MAEVDHLITEYRKRNIGYAVPPRAESWEKLEKELAPARPVRLSPYRWLAIAGVFLLLLSFSIFYFPVSKPVKTIVRTDILPTEEHEKPKLEKIGFQMEVPSLPVCLGTTSPAMNGKQEPADRLMNVKALATPAYNREQIASRSGLIYDLKPIRRTRNILCTDFISYAPEVLAEQSIGKHSEQGWTIGFFGGNLMSRTTSGSAGLGMFNFVRASADMENPFGANNVNTEPGTGLLEDYRNELQSNIPYFHKKTDYEAFEEVALRNYNVSTRTIVRHKFPISAGVSVRKALFDNFSLESGLVYTFLSSELFAGGNSHYWQEQELHYLGIPLKMGYTIWKQKRFSLYASAGAMAEVCVKGRLFTDYYVENVRTHQSKTDMDVNNVQFSVLAALGAQFDVVKSLSLFAEPGVQYFFDDKSGVETIRKEHPLSASVLLGMRVSF